MPRPINSTELRSYHDWQAIGYQVQRGERHVDRDTLGRALFNGTQVRPRNASPMPNPGAYQQRPRRVRPGERAMEVRYVERYVPDWAERYQSTWTSADYGTFNQSLQSLAREYTQSLAQEYTLQTYPAPRAYAAAPIVDPLLEEYGNAMSACGTLQRQLDAIERRYTRKYVPEDDESSNGFKKLSEFERTIKEKAK